MADFSRRDRELRGDDDHYYGGPRAQREDWPRRSFDNNPSDRREGMYEAGGRDFEERLHERGPEEGWWAAHSPMSGERPWYEGEPPHHARFTGGDRGWGERNRSTLVESVKNFFGVGPKGYQRSDERIREEVCEALARHPAVDASDIEVRVKDAHVILTGTVESRLMKRRAEEALDGVWGIEDVRVELTVPRNTDASGELSRAPKGPKLAP